MQASKLDVDESERDTIGGRVQQWQLWMTFFIMEHGIMMLRVTNQGSLFTSKIV
jgi:hypothetical protein